MTEKRLSVRHKLRRIVLLTAFASLVLTSIVGTLSMLRIRNQSESALIAESSQTLINLVTDKAKIANVEFGRYAQITQLFADYLHELYLHPENYKPKTVVPTDPKNAGTFLFQAGASFDFDDFYGNPELKQERELLANIEDVFYPLIVAPDSKISTIYFGLKSGQILCYDDQSDNKPPVDVTYPYQKTAWYSKVEAERKVCFTDVYLDGFGRGLTITCAAPIYDAQDEFTGVIGVDILIKDVYESIVSMDLGEDAYAMLVDSSGNVIAPDGSEHTVQESGLNEAEIASVLGGGHFLFLSENDVYYAYTPVESVGWTLLVYVPKALVLKPVQAMNRGIVSSIIGFVLVFVVILLLVTVAINTFTKHLTEPLIALENDVQQISAGNLDYRVTVRTNDEIGDLAVCFNAMSDSLKKYIADVTKMTAEQERIGAELDVAARIQADLLPNVFPAFPNRTEFDIYASMTPAKEVGGDFYDFFLIDKDHLALVMADVSGKGIPAALFMAVSRTAIRSRAMSGSSPAEILTEVNRFLCADNKENLFVTVWLGIMDVTKGTVEYANAGHEYPVVIHGHAAQELRPAGVPNEPPLALDDELSYTDSSLELAAGDFLLLYTDGIPEAKDADKQRYGMERLTELSGKASAEEAESSAKHIVDSVKADVARFAGDSDPFDDVTILCVEYRGR